MKTAYCMMPFIDSFRVKTIYSSGSQPAVILSLRGHLALYGVIFGCHDWTGSATGIRWVKARMLLTFYNAQDDRHHIELLASDVHSAKGEKLMYKRSQVPVTLR